MKKFFTILAGIGFLFAICFCTGKPQSAGDNPCDCKKTVTITLKSVIKDGKICLEMEDSNGKSAIDNLITDVNPCDKIKWKFDKSSGIKKIVDIYTNWPENERNVFKNHPKKDFFGSGFTLLVPEYAKVSTDTIKGEKYFINFITTDRDTVVIDPYIRVPPEE